MSEPIQADKLDTMAKEAVEKADVAELYRHYQMAMEKCDSLAKAVETIAAHYVGKTDHPRYSPSENAIEAMERVALAAIDLAKSVSAQNHD